MNRGTGGARKFLRGQRNVLYAGKEYSTFGADVPIDAQVRRHAPHVPRVPNSWRNVTSQPRTGAHCCPPALAPFGCPCPNRAHAQRSPTRYAGSVKLRTAAISAARCSRIRASASGSSPAIDRRAGGVLSVRILARRPAARRADSPARSRSVPRRTRPGRPAPAAPYPACGSSGFAGSRPPGASSLSIDRAPCWRSQSISVDRRVPVPVAASRAVPWAYG